MEAQRALLKVITRLGTKDPGPLWLHVVQGDSLMLAWVCLELTVGLHHTSAEVRLCALVLE